MQVKKRIKAFGHAFNGVFTFFRSGVHAQIHLAAVIVVVCTGFWLGLSNMEWIAVLLCFALVLSMEAVNSAIEFLTDLVTPDYHELAKKTKDVAAAAVLFSALFSVIIALIIFIPKLV